MMLNSQQKIKLWKKVRRSKEPIQALVKFTIKWSFIALIFKVILWLPIL